MGGPKLTSTSPNLDSSPSDAAAKGTVGRSGWITRFLASAHIQLWDNRPLEINFGYRQGQGMSAPGASGFRLSLYKPCLYCSAQTPIYLCCLIRLPTGSKLTVGGVRRVLTQASCGRLDCARSLGLCT